MARFSSMAAGLLACAALMMSGSAALAMGSTTESADEKYEQAVALVKKNDYRGAIRLLNEVIEEKPRDADALNYMGYSHRKLGNYNEALAFYKRALAVNPDHKGANEYIGEAYLGLRQPALAETHLQRLGKICGMDCAEYKELKAAIESFKKTGRPSQSSANW